MVDSLPEYEVYALRYATRGGRRSEHFVGGDPHDSDMPMDYYTWIVRSAQRTFIVDTGFTERIALQRKRQFLRCPADSLRLLGIDADRVSDVIITHLHYDHVGNFHRFPAARFHVQEREMAFATGRYMQYPFFSHGYEVDEVVGVVRLLYAGRVELHEGSRELAPGVILHPAPGHTAGLQVVQVHTRRGWLVLASDSTHFFENIRARRPFTVAFHLGHMFDSFRLVESLAASPDHIIPGHDPLLMQLYDPPHEELRNIAVRLDEPPRTSANIGGSSA